MDIKNPYTAVVGPQAASMLPLFDESIDAGGRGTV